MTVGILSDTHGFLDKRVFSHFEKCDEIWHAGDIGSPEVLTALMNLSLPVQSSGTLMAGKFDRRFLSLQFLWQMA